MSTKATDKYLRPKPGPSATPTQGSLAHGLQKRYKPKLATPWKSLTLFCDWSWFWVVFGYCVAVRENHLRSVLVKGVFSVLLNLGSSLARRREAGCEREAIAADFCARKGTAGSQ